MPETNLIKLSSVSLTREKQKPVHDEVVRYGQATNWVIKKILNEHLTRRAQIIEAIGDEFSNQFDKRQAYLNDVIRTAGAEISRHRKLAMTIRSIRERTPYFKKGRAIFSQPIVKLTEKALILTLEDRTQIPIPYDKFSRNQNADNIIAILKGEPAKADTDGTIPLNKRYGRIRLTWNNEGFLNIDIRTNLDTP